MLYYLALFLIGIAGVMIGIVGTMIYFTLTLENEEPYNDGEWFGDE